VSFKRGGDCVCNLIGYISVNRRHQSRDGVDRRCIYQSVEESTKLVLRILKHRCPAASYEARRTCGRGATRTIRSGCRLPSALGFASAAALSLALAHRFRLPYTGR
jgi:hypothetical protein